VSKDPLEELFGPQPEEPKPVPARERLQQEQAERVRTAKLRTEPGPRDRASRAKPWIVVGLVAVVALVASILVVNLARAGGDADEAGRQEAPATSSARPSSDASDTGDAAAKDDAAKDDDAKDADEDDGVPAVDPGQTNTLDIPAWGVTSQLSAKFGSASYKIPDNVNLVLSSPLIDQLPCDGQWGVTRHDDGTYTVLKPAERCAAAPELYDEIWGLTAALVDSIEPVG